jgi:hypothetical protein
MQPVRIKRRDLRIGKACAFALALLCASPRARAGTWDLNMSRLCQLSVANRTDLMDCGGGYDRAIHGDVRSVIPDNAAFRALMSELGVLFAPNVLAPAETYGYNGFTLAAEFGFTTTNPKRNASNPVPDGTGGVTPFIHRYWRAAESVSDTSFAQGDIRSRQILERIERELPPAIAPTVSVMLRKGLWLPVPSFELGAGVRHLIDSRMWAAVVQAKVALHEGFHNWPLPALSVRGMGSRVFNTPGFSLTVAGLDFAMSHHFGIASTFNLMPYLGYQLLWTFADSEVIDATPGVDGIQASARQHPDKLHQCVEQDCNAYFTFDDQTDITRHRFFIGLRANLYIFSALIEYSYFAAGQTGDAIFGLPEIPDASGAQHSINVALALDY